MDRAANDPDQSRRPQDADDQLGRDELVSEAIGVPERMQPPGEPGLVAEEQQRKKRIGEDEADADAAGEDSEQNGPVEHDTGAQS